MLFQIHPENATLIQSGSLLLPDSKGFFITLDCKYKIEVVFGDTEGKDFLCESTKNRSEIIISKEEDIFNRLLPIPLTVDGKPMSLSLCIIPIGQAREILYSLVHKVKHHSEAGSLKHYTIYTDGACSKNPGRGGYCAIIVRKGKEHIVSGHESNTTNNRMEMQAVIAALSSLEEPSEIKLVSDSRYVINTLRNKWAEKWSRNGWKKSDGKPALNADLWEKLLSLTEKHKIEYQWVKGHASNKYNNRCDMIAVAEALKAR